MPRRSYKTARRGQCYAAEWPEWHVDCAAADCDAHALLAGCGEAFTIAEAEREARKDVDMVGWRKRSGLWYCPKHAAP